MTAENWIAVGTWALVLINALFAWWTRRDARDQIEAMRQTARAQVEAAEETARQQVAVTERMTQAHINMLREDLRARSLLHYETLWDSADMIEQRKKLASILLSHDDYLYPRQSDRFPYDVVTDAVPNFFESVGLLLNRGQLEIDMVYHTFAYHALRYGQALGPYVARDQQTHSDETLWNGFLSLFEALREYEKVQLKRPRPDFPAEELIRFFREEGQSPPPVAYRVRPRE
jgi:hypothetical protein